MCMLFPKLCIHTSTCVPGATTALASCVCYFRSYAYTPVLVFQVQLLRSLHVYAISEVMHTHQYLCSRCNYCARFMCMLFPKLCIHTITCVPGATTALASCVCYFRSYAYTPLLVFQVQLLRSLHVYAISEVM